MSGSNSHSRYRTRLSLLASLAAAAGLWLAWTAGAGLFLNSWFSATVAAAPQTGTETKTPGSAIVANGPVRVTPSMMQGAKEFKFVPSSEPPDRADEPSDEHFAGPPPPPPGAGGDDTGESSPAPVTSWKGMERGNGPPDTQVAVSTTHVIVTDNSSMGIFQKSGVLVEKIGIADLFSPLQIGGETASRARIDTYGDTRAIFDPYRNRFWVLALGHNSNFYWPKPNTPPKTEPNTDRNSTGVPKNACDHNHYIVAAAVSLSEDPMDGWYLYWWEAVADYGKSHSDVYRKADEADYPTVGVDPFGIHVSTRVVNEPYWHERTPGVFGCDDDLDKDKKKFRYRNVVFFPGDPMANGASTVKGWQYYNLKGSDENLLDKTIHPAVHHGGGSHLDRIYYLSRDNDNSAMLVWALTNPLKSNQKLERVKVPLAEWHTPADAPQKGSTTKIQMANLATGVLKAVYRDGYVYAVTHDGRSAADGGVLTYVRVIRLNVSNYPNIPSGPSKIDHWVGGNSNDPPGARIYCGWPALEVNRRNDIVVVLARSGGEIYPGASYRVRYESEGEFRRSHALKAGEINYGEMTPEFVGAIRQGHQSTRRMTRASGSPTSIRRTPRPIR